MRHHILPLWSLWSLLIACECRQYHYEKPVTPFAATPPPVLTAVVRTLGPAGKAYEVHLSSANQIYEARQTAAVTLHAPSNAAANGGYLPPTHAAAPYATAPGVASQNFAASYANSNANPQYSPNQNPLLQLQYAAAQPQPSLANAAQFNQANYAQSSHTQSYAGVQSGGANLAEQLNIVGDYVAQSEVGQLDHYPAKQQPLGETRAYARLITTCYGNGQCRQQQLGPGQADPQHQHVVASARAQLAPISDKCRVLAEQKAAASANAATNLPNDPNYAGGSYYQQPLKRPKDRRLVPYTETVIAKDPFN